MTDIMLVYLVIALAAARVAYLLVHDEITRPAREWIWYRWAPENATIRLTGGEGDQEIPARMMHRHGLDADGDHVYASDRSDLTDAGYKFNAQIALRRPTFLGKLIECVYCMSFWIAVPMYLAYRLLPTEIANDLWTWLFMPVAIWSVANWFAAKALG